MKKIFYTLLLMFVITQINATTYYWIGGTTANSFIGQTTWTTNAVTRVPVGATGTLTVVPTDVFIFDGTNVGGTTVVTGPVVIITGSLNATPFAQLKLINGANVNLGRASGGTSQIILAGDGTSAPDLVVDATSTLTLGSLGLNYNAQIMLDTSVAVASTGLISGTVYLSPLTTTTGAHTRSYISAGTGGLVFASGSACHISDSTASSGFNSSKSASVTFQSGASLYYYSGRSPLGNNSATQFTVFEPGSNYYIRGSNVSYIDGTTPYSSSNWTANKTFANVYVQNGASYTADGSLYKIENLTIDAGCTYTTHSSGQTPVTGNLVVEGTLKAPVASTNSLVMGANGAQSITGAGTISVPSFVVCDNADVTLSKSINVDVSTNIVGKINFGTNKISGAATFTGRVGGSALAVTGNTTAGSYIITGVVGALSGNTGLSVTGAGIPANTNVIGFSSGGASVYMSKPATATASGVALAFTSNAATLVTAHSSGFDSTAGSVTVTGLKTYQTGTNYIVNAATTSPIGISSTATTGMIVGNLTLNAPVTTNFKTTVAGTLTLNNGKLTIRPTDTLRIASGNDIAGGLFNSSKYIVTDISGANVGTLRIDSFNTVKTFPVGTSTDYLPVTLTPTDYSTFSVNAFQGVTSDGTPTGTAFTATQKSKIVNAVWAINRTKGTGNTDVNLNWTNALEGSAFAGYTNGQIGISRNDGTAWSVGIASSANNTTNTTTGSFSNFNAFAVGELGAVLPLKLQNLTASLKENKVAINWQAANESSVEKYTIERSANGDAFVEVGTVKALNMGSITATYKWIDASPLNNSNYYRLKIISADGGVKYSSVLLVKTGMQLEVSVYPNPVVNTINLTGLKGNETIAVYDVLGKLLIQKNVAANIAATSIDVSTLKTGTYILKVINANTILAQVINKN